MNDAIKQALEAAYLAGFNASGEGYNGEYPFQDHNASPVQHKEWVRCRDAYVKKALAEQPAQQHIDHCLWARNGNQPCPHVQPAQQQVGTIGHVGTGKTTLTGAIAPILAAQQQYASSAEQDLYEDEDEEDEQPAQQPITGLDVYLDPADELKPKLYSPQPAPKPWVGLTEKEKQHIKQANTSIGCLELHYDLDGILADSEAKLREKNQ